MKLFKKKIEAYDFGKALYLMVIDLLFNKESPVELEKLIVRLHKRHEGELSNNHQLEAIILLVYQTFIIIFYKFEQHLSYIILKGMKDEFIIHCIELGAPERESEILRDLFDERFKQYIEVEKLQSHETLEKWVIIFLQNILSDNKGFLNAFLWLPVMEFITIGVELMGNYIDIFLNTHKIVNK